MSQQPAPQGTDRPGRRSPAMTVYLSSPCDTCDHTLNWHDNQSGCTVPRCTCGRFQSAPEAPR